MDFSSLFRRTVFPVQKLQHRLRRTEEEKVLEERTSNAISSIAAALEIPVAEYWRQMPLVLCEPALLAHLSTEASYAPSLNIISYSSSAVSQYTVFEEAGHFLHASLINEIFHSRSAEADPVTHFFASSNREAIGFFCSQLSGEERKDTYIDFCQDKTLEEEMSMSVEEGLFLLLLQRFQEKSLAEKSGDFLYDLIRSSLEEYRPHFEQLASLSPATLYAAFLLQLEEQCQRTPPDAGNVALAQDPKNFFSVLPQSSKLFFCLPDGVQEDLGYLAALLEHDSSLFNTVHHLIGYDLGAALFRLYQDDPMSGKQLVKAFMQVPAEEALPTFFDMQRKVSDAGYSPLEQLAESKLQEEKKE
ncbi:MAG: hypothetical protein Q8R53_02415 [Nanoarchaeota archaeon]|nr:hypothetical protein [Nanoarchaeota archaeon]